MELGERDTLDTLHEIFRELGHNETLLVTDPPNEDNTIDTLREIFKHTQSTTDVTAKNAAPRSDDPRIPRSPEPEQPAPLPPQPEIPSTGPAEPKLPSPDPAQPPFPAPGPTDPTPPQPIST
jgi:hypothetical protein